MVVLCHSSKTFPVCPTKALTLTACQLLQRISTILTVLSTRNSTVPCLDTLGKHLPSIALKALSDILSEGEIGVSIDGDAVVIVESLSHSKPLKKKMQEFRFGRIDLFRNFEGLCSLLLSRNNQFSQAQVASICASFVRNALLHASITCKNLRQSFGCAG